MLISTSTFTSHGYTSRYTCYGGVNPMTTWSGIRHKLETEYLAISLRGHIQYFVTTYSKSPDHEGRAAIRYNGKEIIKGNYWNQYVKAHLFPKDDTYERRMHEGFPFIDNTALELGVFDQRCFYQAFKSFMLFVCTMKVCKQNTEGNCSIPFRA